MACFGLLSRLRRSKSRQLHSSSSTPPQRPQISQIFHNEALRIAQIPVGGIQRNANHNSTFSCVRTCHSVTSKGREPSNTNDGRRDTFLTDSTDETLIGSQLDLGKKGAYSQGQQSNKSAWQGKPNGTVYDRRTELTEEDEDMWARMAM